MGTRVRLPRRRRARGHAARVVRGRRETRAGRLDRKAISVRNRIGGKIELLPVHPDTLAVCVAQCLQSLAESYRGFAHPPICSFPLATGLTVRIARRPESRYI